MRCGSSPLARGLRRTRRHPTGRPGIIPARAGFTWPLHPTPLRLEDHPRSRGVYAGSGRSTRTKAGSSPLARGLPRRPRRACLQSGIIPARAGFTRFRTCAVRRPPDHPRSRGVYPAIAPQSPICAGSSPLARGLRCRPGGAVAGPGIIPARAGFTQGGRPSGNRRSDHPRSRGVYAELGGGCEGGRGSSPLARGLREGGRSDSGDWGIIPARAGFTLAGPVEASAPEDHPRSRGVYAQQDRSSPQTAGSSPLARGLPTEEHTMTAMTRIIPARAGFTPCKPAPGHDDTDHPRSRGVYARSPVRRLRERGSSPLARGLPVQAGAGAR